MVQEAATLRWEALPGSWREESLVLLINERQETSEHLGLHLSGAWGSPVLWRPF